MLWVNDIIRGVGMNLRNELIGGCSIGVLIIQDILNVPSCENLDHIKKDLEESIKAEYGQTDRNALKLIHPMDVYVAYYKKFGYTYHVLPQLESIASGKTIPSIMPLIEAMFMAEIKNMILTAGHDMTKIISPLYFKSASGKENYVSLSGKEVLTVPGDFLISDEEGVISSILRGPDKRTSINADTNHVLFTAYAPTGISRESIYRHLSDIESYVKIFSVKSITTLKEIYGQ